MEGLRELTEKHCPGGVTWASIFSFSQRLKEHFTLFSADICRYIMTSTNTHEFNFTSQSPVSCLLVCNVVFDLLPLFLLSLY